MSDSKPPDPGQAIQKSPAQSVQVGRAGVALQNLDDLLKFADMCVKGAVAPKGMTREAAAVAIQAGMERGLGPLGGLQAGVVINGVLSWRGWAAVGFIQNSPVIVPGTFKSWVENPATDQAVGYCRAQRRGYDQPFLRSFSVLDAKKAGLWKKGGPWDARPDNMLEWRAIGDMGRFHFGDVLGGFPIAEDVEAGGIGLAEAPRELPATREPAPATLVSDPILAELVEEAPAAPGGAAGPPTVAVRGGHGTTREVQAVIDAQAIALRLADEVESRLRYIATVPVLSVRQVEDEAGLRGSLAEVFASPKTVDPGGPCPRCSTKRNVLNGCDCCGWPGEDNGERP